jgi:dTDP-4-amino-4,6-dideoxygalactose transaminase
MIPDYSPPFGPVRALYLSILPRAAPTVADLEMSYAESLAVPQAVLLPSVRSGILMILKAMTTPDSLVVGPAYTCGVVHQAMHLSGARLRFVDPAFGQFLMAEADILAAVEPDACLVLSELYGIPYSDNLLRGIEDARPRVRILDMAMSIPDPARLNHLQARDVALFSFGMNKCMYAGGGGIACLKDGNLAEQMREIRDASIAEDSRMSRLCNQLGILARVCIRTRPLYRLGTAVAATWRRGRARKVGRNAAAAPPAGAAPAALSAEWTRPMSPFNRKLALYDLRHAETSKGLRRRQAETYAACLNGSNVLSGVAVAALPESHFPIRVEATLRERVREYLEKHGICTAIEFPFPPGLNRHSVPNALKASEEVITLPMGENLTLDEVKMISKCVLQSLQDSRKQHCYGVAAKDHKSRSQ